MEFLDFNIPSTTQGHPGKKEGERQRGTHSASGVVSPISPSASNRSSVPPSSLLHDSGTR